MHPNEALIHSFYQAFQNKDYRTMQETYHPAASFSDPVFQHLSAEEVKAMWEMLITSAKNLEITYGQVKADANQGVCRWEARYTFSGTGRRVRNIIDVKWISGMEKFSGMKIILISGAGQEWHWEYPVY